MKIPVDKIIPNPQQPRKTFSNVELSELAASIKENGLVHPVVVEEGVGQYILIDGERRLRAHKILGLAEIEAFVRPVMNGSGKRERTILALIANIQHSNLSPCEEGAAFERLSQMGMSNTAIAKKLGTNIVRVASRRALLALDPEIRDLIDEGLLPVDQRATTALQKLPGEVRVEFARKLARPGLAIKTVQTSVDKYLAATAAEKVSGEPAPRFAYQRSGKPNLPNWDALHQLGRLPSWPITLQAANYTCETCELRAEASAIVCSRCPAVMFLAKLIEMSHDHAH